VVGVVGVVYIVGIPLSLGISLVVTAVVGEIVGVLLSAGVSVVVAVGVGEIVVVSLSVGIIVVGGSEKLRLS
jgi:hypothetical protein